MKKNSKDFTVLVTQLENFLNTHNWIEDKKSKDLRFFNAPSNLNLANRFSIALPIDPTRSGIEVLLLNVVNSLKDLYGFKVNEYYNVLLEGSLEDNPTRFNTRFIDKETKDGIIPLISITQYLTGLERSLYHSAKFKLGVDNNTSKLAAEQFTKNCRFLQTEAGSFVTHVEVPQQVIRQSDLFGTPALLSAQVCSSLFSAVEFLNKSILNSDENFESDEMLTEALQLFDPTLLDSLSKLIVDHKMQVLEFSLEIGSQKRDSSTGILAEDRVARLNDYVKFIKNHFNGENDLDITGSIVELRSRDPQGNRNHILIVSNYQNENTYISATLNNEQYQLALDTHRNKRTVRIKGNGMRLKTQIRMVEITDFLA